MSPRITRVKSFKRFKEQGNLQEQQLHINVLEMKAVKLESQASWRWKQIGSQETQRSIQRGKSFHKYLKEFIWWNKDQIGSFCFLTVSLTSTGHSMESGFIQSNHGCNPINLVQSVPLCFPNFFNDKQDLKKNSSGPSKKSVGCLKYGTQPFWECQ